MGGGDSKKKEKAEEEEGVDTSSRAKISEKQCGRGPNMRLRVYNQISILHTSLYVTVMLSMRPLPLFPDSLSSLQGRKVKRRGGRPLRITKKRWSCLRGKKTQGADEEKGGGDARSQGGRRSY